MYRQVTPMYHDPQETRFCVTLPENLHGTQFHGGLEDDFPFHFQCDFLVCMLAFGGVVLINYFFLFSFKSLLNFCFLLFAGEICQ